MCFPDHVISLQGCYCGAIRDYKNRFEEKLTLLKLLMDYEKRASRSPEKLLRPLDKDSEV